MGSLFIDRRLHNVNDPQVDSTASTSKVISHHLSEAKEIDPAQRTKSIQLRGQKRSVVEQSMKDRSGVKRAKKCSEVGSAIEI